MTRPQPKMLYACWLDPDKVIFELSHLRPRPLDQHAGAEHGLRAADELLRREGAVRCAGERGEGLFFDFSSYFPSVLRFSLLLEACKFFLKGSRNFIFVRI